MQTARIVVPTPVQKAPPHSFPLLATVAPVGMSVAIWLVTKSPYALMFAGLGPAVALASVADARRQSKRLARSEKARFARELLLARAEVVAEHERERAELDLDAPSAAVRLARGDHDPERWTSSIQSCTLTIGRGVCASRVELDVAATRDPQARPLLELATFTRELSDAPVVVAPALGIAVVGPLVVASATARGYVAQLAARLDPKRTTIEIGAPPAPEHWLNTLPHRLVVDPSLRAGELAFVQDVARAVIAVADSVDNVPSHVRVVVHAGPDGRIVRHPDRSRCVPLALEYASREQARSWALRLAQLAGPLGAGGLAGSVTLSELLGTATPLPGGLAAPIGLTVAGPCVVDLVRDGPHAIVGGTTGSGKSELLISWVLALANAYPPSEATFLLVDFKGGSSFGPLEQLPHCVGVISDLDDRSAVRALESLRAEVRFRERTLAHAGARSIEDLSGELPRLVIVVDEFAALVADYPDLHAVFADVAARGRSLGLHLVLCTQRPAGVVRDAVLANAGLRVSLRVNNRADSRAVVDSDAAADLPAHPRGRALVSVAGEAPRELQVALAGIEESAAVISRWAGAASPRRPWRDPLPGNLATADLGVSDGIAFALADLPQQQAQPTVGWQPERDGHVLIVGAARSGKSNALAALGRTERRRVVPKDAERAWDSLFEVLGDIRSGLGEVVVLLDDLDAILARYSDEHASAFIEALTAVLREGPTVGVHVVLAAQRITPGLHGVVSLCDIRLLLRMPSKQDHIIAGGAGDQFDPSAPPGRGTWGGNIIQIALADPLPTDHEQDLERLVPPLVIVSSYPRASADRVRDSGASVGLVGDGIEADVILGDPEAWQSRWGWLQAANATVPVYFEGCSLADFRMLTRSRVLPPPIVTSRGAGWVLTTDGRVHRGRF